MFSYFTLPCLLSLSLLPLLRHIPVIFFYHRMPKKPRCSTNNDEGKGKTICEEMLLIRKKIEELKNKRCQNIFKFLTVRGLMLMNTTTIEEDEECVCANSKTGVAGAGSNTSLLLKQVVVADINKFKFHSNLTSITSKPFDEVRLWLFTYLADIPSALSACLLLWTESPNKCLLF